LQLGFVPSVPSPQCGRHEAGEKRAGAGEAREAGDARQGRKEAQTSRRGEEERSRRGPATKLRMTLSSKTGRRWRRMRRRGERPLKTNFVFHAAFPLAAAGTGL
jgi:hypothetical protein